MEKRAGMELWDKLVAEHGEPATLKAVTGSGGFHFYFSRSGSVGLNRMNNFAGLVVDGVALKGARVAELDESLEKSVTYGIDGRGVDGLCFAPPSRYMGKQGETKTYSWALGGDGVPQPMPAWLVDVINACFFGAKLPVAPELSAGLPTPQPFAIANGGVRSFPKPCQGREMHRPSKPSKGLRFPHTLDCSCLSSRQCSGRRQMTR